jgi:3-dehydroquinate synthase
MTPHSININVSAASSSYPIMIGRDLLAGCGRWLRQVLGPETKRVVIVSNPTVLGLYGEVVGRSIASAGFDLSHYLMKDGEQHKSLRTAEALLAHLSATGIGRTDAIVALGGGVVGDLAGFAAAVHLRGIPFVQIPTTLLAMIDASVGGKTAVNTPSGKNLAGAFHQPRSVLIDAATLETLPKRELSAGLFEAVKHGALGGHKLLAQTSAAVDRFGMDHQLVTDLIAAQVAYKAKIVAGDPLESPDRLDPRSRKILNFGHTLAHALEKVTAYKYFKHGEAVGYGILFAGELSKTIALCSENDIKLLNDVVRRAGTLPSLVDIDPKKVFEAFANDKKRLSDTLQMVLLKGIGKPVIVTENDIPRPTILSVLKRLFRERA